MPSDHVTLGPRDQISFYGQYGQVTKKSLSLFLGGGGGNSIF